MSAVTGPVFVDTVYWMALVVKSDQHHPRAVKWSKALQGEVITTDAVLIETANSLSKPDVRGLCAALIDDLRSRPRVTIIALSDNLLSRAWTLYKGRSDKSWSLTDTISFVVMGDRHLTAALTADDDFRQAGFRLLLNEEP